MSNTCVLLHIHVWLDREAAPEWAGPHHKVLYLEPHKDAHSTPATSAERLHAAKWRVGVISRVVITLARELMDNHIAADHGCASRYGHEHELEACGELYAYDLIDQPQTLAAGDEGYVGVIVPAEQADQWADRARQLVNEVITSDARPPAPEPDHHQVTLTEPATTQPRKAST